MRAKEPAIQHPVRSCFHFLFPLPRQPFPPLAHTMVSIDLDNIIHYHPPVIPKLPCKPPYLHTSRDSFHPSSNLPILVHPLPPRPPRPSYDSQQTHFPRHSPSPVASCLSGDHYTDMRTKLVHLNDFDKELAEFDSAGIQSHGPPGLGVGDSEESQTEDINSAQKKEADDLFNGKRLPHPLALRSFAVLIGCIPFSKKQSAR